MLVRWQLLSQLPQWISSMDTSNKTWSSHKTRPTSQPQISQWKPTSYGTTIRSSVYQLDATVEGGHQQQDMELTQNQAYVTTNIPDAVMWDHNSILSGSARCHSGGGTPATRHGAHTNVTTTNIPVETNQHYGTTTPSVDQLYATVEGAHQQQDMELAQNQAYVTATISQWKPTSVMAPQLPQRISSMPATRHGSFGLVSQA